jgi:hypothetical protein
MTGREPSDGEVTSDASDAALKIADKMGSESH